MNLLCPSKNLFSYKIKNFLEKFLICDFVNINQKQFEKVVHKYEIVFLINYLIKKIQRLNIY